MKYLVILVLVLILAACGDSRIPPRRIPDGPCGRTFVVSVDFPAHERAAIQRAAERWNAIATEQLCLADGEVDPSQDTTIIFRIAQDSDYWRSLYEHFGGHVLGIHYGQSDVIGLLDTMPIDQFELVALHEFGHAHGLGHTNAPAVMHAYQGSSSDFTEIDMAECRRAGACPGGEARATRLSGIEVLYR